MKRILTSPLTYILLLSIALLYPLSYSDLTEGDFVANRNILQYIPVGWAEVESIGWSNCLLDPEPYQFTGFPLYTYEFSLTGHANCDQVRSVNPLAFALNGVAYMFSLSAIYLGVRSGISFLSGKKKDPSVG